MFKMHLVGLLKEGDRFAFVSDAPRQINGGGTASSARVLIVTRTAQVNRAAESCFFRYREAEDPTNTNHSWNGHPDVNVQLEVEGFEEPAAPVAPAPSPAKPERRRPVKLIKQKTVAPTKAKTAAGKRKPAVKVAVVSKSAKAKSKVKKSAAKTAVVLKPTKVVKPSQRLVLRSTTGSTAEAAEHSNTHEKRPALTPQLKLKKSRRA